MGRNQPNLDLEEDDSCCFLSVWACIGANMKSVVFSMGVALHCEAFAARYSCS
jgi:hypothetical protein